VRVKGCENPATQNGKKMSYKKLDIYNKGMELFFRVHPLSLKLPKYEMYELGSQIRRSADAIVSNIAEGYGRRRYKADYIRFLIYSHSSNDETLSHITKLQQLYPDLQDELLVLEREYDSLGAQINTFIKYVESNWRT